jgi:hypothetical protein
VSDTVLGSFPRIKATSTELQIKLHHVASPWHPPCLLLVASYLLWARDFRVFMCGVFLVSFGNKAGLWSHCDASLKGWLFLGLSFSFQDPFLLFVSVLPLVAQSSTT